MSEFYQNEPQLELRDREPNITVVPTCPYCKREIMAGAAFCPYCSARLDQPMRPNGSDPYQQGGAQQFTRNSPVGYDTQQYPQHNAGGYGEPVPPRNAGGYGGDPYPGYGTGPVPPRNAGGYGGDPYPQHNAGGYSGGQFSQGGGGYGGSPYQQNNAGYGAQQYQQQYIPQPQKVDLQKHDQRPYYDQPYPAPDVRTVNTPYDYAPQDGLFTPQSFDSSQIPYTGTVQPNGSPRKMRNKWVYFILTMLLGFFGAHNFYENKPIKGALWYVPFIPFSIGVAQEIMDISTDDTWAGIFAIFMLFNCFRYLFDLVKAIIRLANTQGDEYPSDK
ncbi:MAG: TM2 domain-containing protein [Oscillospiraceae bacterium]|nr:TM2 domain-containing protein [Oscillospiraceae bacterium]